MRIQQLMTKEVMYLKLEDYIGRFEERKQGNDINVNSKTKEMVKKKINKILSSTQKCTDNPCGL